MWLEHLLFGAVIDTSFSVVYEVQVSLDSVIQSFLHITASAAAKRKSSLTSLRKDNEVKLEEEIN